MKMIKRMIALLCICVLMLALVPINISAKTPGIMNETEWELLKLTNAERVKAGMKPLSTFNSLQWCSDTRLGELSRFFSHTRPDGTSCITIYSGLKNLNHFGENVAAGYITPTEVLNIWMNSQNGHKENILYPNFSHLATGYISIPNDKYTRYWVQNFVGDCSFTSAKCDETPVFDTEGKLINENVALVLTCVHGTSYMPLINAKFVCNSTAHGEAIMQVTIDKKTFNIPCAVGYTDIKKGAWYYDSVVRAGKLGLFSGVTETTFVPGGDMTRAMLVSVLYRMEGSPDIAFTNKFTDVPRGQWYSKAVAWAEVNKIVSGMSSTTFVPNGKITREQIVSILYRYANYQGKATTQRKSIDSFKDVSYIHDYALDSIQWAYATGLMKGKSANILDPLGNATRAEVCAMVIRYLDTIK